MSKASMIRRALRAAMGTSGMVPRGGRARVAKVAQRDAHLAQKGWDDEGAAFDRYERTRQAVGGRDRPVYAYVNGQSVKMREQETALSEGVGRKVAEALHGKAIDRAQRVRDRGLKAERVAERLRPSTNNAAPISAVAPKRANEALAMLRRGERLTPKQLYELRLQSSGGGLGKDDMALLAAAERASPKKWNPARGAED